MEINVYRRRNSIPGTTGGVNISPDKVAEPYMAEAQQGEAISKLGFQAAELNQRFQEAEKRAERVVEAQKLENTLKEAFLNSKTEIDTNGDYKQYEAYADNKINEIKAQHIDSIQDPIVKRAAESVFINQSGDLKRHAKVEKIKLMRKESLNYFDKDIEETSTRIANTTDETVKQYERDKLKLKGLELEAAKTIDIGTTEKVILGLDQRAEAIYAGTLINNNAEVAYSYLRERNNDGTYKNLPNLKPEDRISLINNAESGMRSQRVEWNREWDTAQTDTISKIYNDMDNKAVPRSQIRAEIEKAEKAIDPKTGQRLLNPVTAHNLKRELEGEDSSGGTGSASEYGRVGNLILEGKINTDEISSNPLLSNTERKELTRMLWATDKRGNTAEGKDINEDLKIAYSYAKDSLDAILPSVGESNSKNRELNEAARAYLTFKLQGRETKEDVESYKKHVGEILQWAKENAGNKKTNARMAEQLVAGIFPENFDQANLANQEKWVMNNAEKIKAKFKNSPAGTYYMPGSKTPINWDGKGGYNIEVKPKTQEQPISKNQNAPATVPKGWEKTGELYDGKPVYIDENGKKKVWIK